MARTPDGITARSVHVTARFRPSVAATLDRLRGETPRSRYLEKLVLDAERRNESTDRRNA